jgi:hypothetical protein
MLLISVAVILAFGSCTHAGPNLMELGECATKGRFQDKEYNPNLPVIDELIEMGESSIPYLISHLNSEKEYTKSPLCYWPSVKEGDISFFILSDFFLDDSWKKVSHPRACESASFDYPLDDYTGFFPAFRLYVTENGRGSIIRNWSALWRESKGKLKWNQPGRYFEVMGYETQSCDELNGRADPLQQPG